MSQKTEYICDRCGKEIEWFDVKRASAKIQLYGPGEYRAGPGQRIDLCQECYEKFVNFLERT